MNPEISEAAFDALLSQTDLTLSREQKETLYRGYAYIEVMIRRISRPKPREAEPALVFVPEMRP